MRETEAFYRDVVEGTNDLITSVDREGRFVYINHKALDFYGLSPPECEGQYAFDFIHPDDKDATRAWFDACVAEGVKQASVENRQVNRKDGSVHHMLWTSTFYYDQHGKVTGVKGIARDITKRKLAEQKLRESENKFRSLFNQASDSIFLLSIADDDLIIEDANDAAFAIHGYGRDELIGKGITFLDDRQSAAHVPERIQELIDGQCMAFEVNHVRKDGSVFPVEVNAKVIHISDKPYIIAIDRDMTERKMAEQALAESEERYRNMFNNSYAAMLLIDPETAGIIDANRAALQFYGYTYEKIISMKITDLNTLAPEEVAREIARAKKEERNHFIFPHRLESGDIRTVEVYSGPVNVKGKQLLFSIIHDISDRIGAEQDRKRLTEELEQIIFVASHDLRSPMLNIHGYSQIMSESVEKCRSLIRQSNVAEDLEPKLQKIFDEYIAEPVQYIHKSIKQIDSMLSGLLSLSRSERVELNVESLDMNRLLSDVTGSFDLTLKEMGITLHVSDLPSCRGDQTQIGQVFTNLIGNAIKYLAPERAGMIRITGRQKGAESLYCVEDNGIGIASEDRDRIFAIFHQVKRSVSGEGLGLTIVKKTIERHKGRIWVESEPGRGSSFYVSLPSAGHG